MNIISILAGIEKLVVELLLWLIFIPKTLFKIIAEPTWVSNYVDEELTKKSDKFVNFISPIMLFLVSSVVLFFILEHSDFDAAENINPDKLLKDLKGTTGILAGLGFLSLPLLFAMVTEFFRKAKFTQDGIQRILYIQCYYFSPLILSVFVFTLFTNILPEDELIITLPSFFLMIGLLIWFLVVEIKLISHEIQSGKLKAIGVFLGTIIVFILGFSFLISASESGEVDMNDVGGIEEISGLTIPHNGEFSIVISSFTKKAGKYRLTLTDSTNENQAENELYQNTGNNILNMGVINYGQIIDGYFTKGDSSIWTFIGRRDEQINIKVEPQGNLDVVFDVRDENEKTIIEPEDADYTMLLGYLYLLIIGWAVIRGFISMFKKSPKVLENESI